MRWVLVNSVVAHFMYLCAPLNVCFGYWFVGCSFSAYCLVCFCFGGFCFCYLFCDVCLCLICVVGWLCDLARVVFACCGFWVFVITVACV